MAQQRVVGAIAQRQPNLTDAARRCGPSGRIAIKLKYPLVVGKTGNTKITLRHTLYAKQAFFAYRAEQR